MGRYKGSFTMRQLLQIRQLQDIQIRKIQACDASAFNQLIKSIEAESHFMLRESGERQSTDENQKAFIERMNAESGLLVALVNEKFAGFIIVLSEGVNKKKHSRYLAMGVLSAYAGLGIGTKLMGAAFDFCREQKVYRLELTVITNNYRALGLYNKMNFKIEGTKQKSLMIQGVLMDEYQMAAFII
jgi:ribosomal protein S18 acetylase RimI-like enzyme